jgi:hypothetical protein
VTSARKTFEQPCTVRSSGKDAAGPLDAEGPKRARWLRSRGGAVARASRRRTRSGPSLTIAVRGARRQACSAELNNADVIAALHQLSELHRDAAAGTDHRDFVKAFDVG